VKFSIKRYGLPAEIEYASCRPSFSEFGNLFVQISNIVIPNPVGFVLVVFSQDVQFFVEILENIDPTSNAYARHAYILS
jgi:hypothetical protein